MSCLIRVFIMSSILPISFSFLNATVERKLIANCSALVLNNIKHDRNHNLIYVFSQEFDEVITSILLLVNRPFILSDQFLLPRHNHELLRIFPLVYLFYAANWEYFIDLFERINVTHSSWYPRANFVILVNQDADFEPSKQKLNLMAQLFFSVNIYNFVILLPSSRKKVINIYKWNPYDEASKCGSYIQLQKIDECDGNKLQKSTSTFTIKKFLKGCTFRVSAFAWPPYTYASESDPTDFVNGYNVLTMEALSHMFKFKIKYIPIENDRRWGTMLSNGTWTGGLGTLQKNEADATIGGCLQTSMRFLAFDCSPTFTPLTIKFYLALPGKLPHWKTMMHIFSFQFWIALITAYFITCIFIWILSRLVGDRENRYFNSFRNCVFCLWRFFVGTSNNILPVSEVVRIVFLLWLIFCFHITSLYSSALLGVITTPVFEEPMRSLNEFTKTNLPVFLVPQFVQISSRMDKEFNTVISARFHEYKPDDGKDIDRMITKKDIVIFDPEEHFELQAQEKLFSIYSLEENIRLNPGIYLRRGSIFLEYVNTIQYLTTENGMFSKWKRDLIGNYRYKRHQRNNYENEILPLTLEELSGSFYILTIGLLLSIMAFILEQVMFKYQRAP